MRAKYEGVHAAGSPELVEDAHVGVHVIHVVSVGRVLEIGPLFGRRYFAVEHGMLGFALVVDRVEANDVLEEPVELRMGARIVGRLEQRSKQVVD